MTVIGPGLTIQEHYRGQATLTAQVVFTPALADTYEAVPGTWTDGACNGFTTSAAGLVTYSGPSGAHFLFSGASDLSAGASDTVTYALFANGVLIPGAETPHVFASAGKTENISITAIIELNTGDTLQVYAKSSGKKQLTVDTLRITIWGS